MKPIIMSAESVRAILDGRKTQTRRVVKPQPRDPRTNFHFSLDGVWLLERRGYENYAARSEDGMSITCPYTVGQRLWVRETWTDIHETFPGNLHYKASATNADLEWFVREGWRWRSPIHMPRWASRITLEVTGVRAERVQEITYDDIVAEGWNPSTSEPFSGGTAGDDARLWFELRWRALRPDSSPYCYDLNPWVWVVEFRRLA